MNEQGASGGDDTGQPHLTGRARLVSLLAVILAAFGIGLSYGIAFPLTSLTLESWQAPKWQIGLAGAAPSLAVLSALPFVPRIVHSLGAVRTMTLGCLVGALGFFALSRFQSAEAWILIRFAMSAGLALPWLAGETWMNLVTPRHTRGRVIALFTVSFFLGYAAGPTVLGSLGIDGPAIFVAGALSMALAGVPILLAARYAPSIGESEISGGFGGALKIAPAAMAGAFIGGFAEMSYLALFPNVALAGGLNQADTLGAMSSMSIGGCILQLFIGWLADTAPKHVVTQVLGALFIALTLTLPFALESKLFAFGAAFFIGGAILGFYTIGLATVGDEASPTELALVNAAFLFMYQVGAILGPAAAGIAMTYSPVSGFVVMMTGFMAVSMVAFRRLIAPRTP